MEGWRPGHVVAYPESDVRLYSKPRQRNWSPDHEIHLHDYVSVSELIAAYKVILKVMKSSRRSAETLIFLA
jgi:hypothetical protein